MLLCPLTAARRGICTQSPLLRRVSWRHRVERFTQPTRLSYPAPPPKRHSSSAYKPILTHLPPSEEPLEEETLFENGNDRFYSVAPGDVIHNGRYSIISKSNWGAYSTLWLAEDLHQPTQSRYVSIVFGNPEDEARRKRVLDIHHRIRDTGPGHKGYNVATPPVNPFVLTSEHGTHTCMVLPAFWMTLAKFIELHPRGKIPLTVVKSLAFWLLQGLDYLHDSCNIIHTDLTPENIVIAYEDFGNGTSLAEKVERLKTSEHFYKQTPTGRVFQSHDSADGLENPLLYPLYADFDEANFDILKGRAEYSHAIQSDAYRAPEVILGWGWTNKVDIWNISHVIWTMYTGRDLFDSLYYEDGFTYCAPRHLAQMICVLGPPDPELIRERTSTYHRWSMRNESDGTIDYHDANSWYGGPFFNAHSGEFLQSDLLIEPQPLESLLVPSDDKEDAKEGKLFIEFIRSMLTWDPDQRWTAKELLKHPWFADFAKETDEGGTVS